MNKVISINEKNIHINNSVEQALQDGIKDKDRTDSVLIIQMLKTGGYGWIQGGQDPETMTRKDMLWHLEQMKMAVLEERICIEG